MTRKSRQRKGAPRVVGIIWPVPSRPVAVHVFLHEFRSVEAPVAAEAHIASACRRCPSGAAASSWRCGELVAPIAAVPRERALYAAVMARLSQHGLRRVLGTSALFSTAYGNVGSSIYYALGLVAPSALGLTPIVFLLTGALFALTAKTYSEGAAMFPEAGGSSSFARHAFNELVSFIAGWALSLDYILTIAISAFFVPHHLLAFWPALTHPPGDVIGGLVVIGVLAWLNIRGIGESARLNFFLA